MHDEVLARLAALGEVEANRTRLPWSRRELTERAASADALLAFMTDHVDADFLSACPRLKVIACALKGFDNFDVAACTAAGVWVTIVPDLLTNPTAELAVALALGLGRKLREATPSCAPARSRAGGQSSTARGSTSPSSGLSGWALSARAIATRLVRLRLPPPRGRSARGAAGRDGPLPICRVALADSDYSILAVPLAPDSVHLIGRDALKRVKPGALLINVGRGSVVDEAAVADALEDGTLGGYAADVFEMEDWARADRPAGIEPRLLSHPRTLFTPHLGSAVDRVRREIALQAADDIVASRSAAVHRDTPSTGRAACSRCAVSADPSPP